MSFGTTGTGLDRLVDIIREDEGLQARITQAEIQQGAAAADRMNQIIVEGVQALGIANDGALTAGDVRDLADWVRTTHRAEFTELHGDDEDGVETGFHLVQRDGGAMRLYGDAAIDTVADGIYHLVFGYRGDNITNEDGNRNARLESIAWWLEELLEPELAAAAAGEGPLYNAETDPMAVTVSGSGLDQLVGQILDDPGLNRKISTSELQEGAQAAADLNAMIKNVIVSEGLANDGEITASDVREINAVIRADDALYARFVDLHGNDENGVETGFHLVQGDGAEFRLFERGAVDTVADGIYHIGFEIQRGRFLNEDGNANASVGTVAEWMNALLERDLEAGWLANPAVDPVPDGATGTGLDQIVEIIAADEGLHANISISDMAGGAAAANEINAMILEGIHAVGAANDGEIDTADIRDVNAWIREDAARYASFVEAHGNDEDDVETGYHLVQGDRAQTRLFGENAVDTIGDGIYHIGFEIDGWRFENEDGDKNASVEDVAAWIDLLLSDADMEALRNDAVVANPVGTTGTGLDVMVEAVVEDPRFREKYAASDLAEIGQRVDQMNKILVQAIQETGAADGGFFDTVDLKLIGQWIRENAAERWAVLRGEDDAANVVRAGVMGLQWEGGVIQMGDDRAIDEVARGVYTLGLGEKWDSLRDEDGDWAASFSNVAAWMNELLADELESGALAGTAPREVAPETFADARVLESQVAVNVTEDDGSVEIKHTGDLELANGTVTLSFIAEDLRGKGSQTIFSKDASGPNEGDVRVYFWNEELYARVSTEGEYRFLKVADGFTPGDAYDLALTFGDQGLGIWINGDLQAYDSTIKIDWLSNDNDVQLGASNGSQTEEKPDKLTEFFKGEVYNFAVYDRALSLGEIEGLSEGATRRGGDGADDLVGTDATDALYGGLGQDVLIGGAGNDGLYGGYGADRLLGGDGDDILDGGHGHDIIDGGAGDDIIISTGDAREPWVAQLKIGPNGVPEDESGFAGGGATGPCPITSGGVCHCGSPRDATADEDPYQELDAETGKLYPDQPLPADDLLIGGEGADIFRIQTQINAKRHIIEKHTRDDGTINWGGVAGENDNYHDHWVEGVGYDTIADFNRNEGDRIEIAGHTTQIASITYNDSDGDGIDDYSMIYLISDQGGNGGAHDQDLLGKIRVDDTILRYQDISVDSGPTYGIVETIWELEEAITPLEISDLTPREAADSLAATEAEAREDAGASIGAPVAAALADGVLRKGDGLAGRVYNSQESIGSIHEFLELTSGAGNQRISVSEIEFGGGKGQESVASFLGENGAVVTGDANMAMDTVGLVLDGFVYLTPGVHRIEVTSDDGFRLEIGGEEVIQYAGLRSAETSSTIVDAGEGGLFAMNLAYFENGGGQVLKMKIDGEVVGPEHIFTSLAAFEAAPPLEQAGDAEIGRTGTGLDQLVDVILNDPGLSDRLDDAEISEGADAAYQMNRIIVTAINETGAAHDGAIDVADVMAISDWIAANRGTAFTYYHGDDEGDAETGFHLVQNDGAATRLFGDSAVDTVADGVYHLVFGYRDGRIVNEDGARNATLEDIAWWLETLLEDDLAAAREGAGALYNAAAAESGAAPLVPAPVGEETLQATAADAPVGAAAMALRAALGQPARDAEDLAFWAQDAAPAVEANSPDMIGKVLSGMVGEYFGANRGGESAADDADGFDALGGAAGAEAEEAAPLVVGSTGVGLDRLVEVIVSDHGLKDKISEADITAGAEAADAINALIKEAIIATGVAQNGMIKTSDIYEINAYIRENSDRYNAFVAAHGNDEGAAETGFHRVQNDGARLRIFDDNAVDTVADGLYHIGFEIKDGRLTNEDGDKNASLATAAGWLDSLLTEDDYQALAAASSANPYLTGSTGTGLDAITQLITEDDGLIERISTSEIRDGAAAADGLNALILEKIEETGAADDGGISAYDVLQLNKAIREDADALARFTALHGDDEDGVETGFHLVQGDGARTHLYGQNAIDRVADGLYHIGFEVEGDRFLNEDGDKNASVNSVAMWLDDLLSDDLASGALARPAEGGPVDVSALRATEVFALTEPLSVDETGGERVFEDFSALEIEAGTVLIDFSVAETEGWSRKALFSRDGSGYGDGGHMTMWVRGDDLVARVQDRESEIYLEADNVIEAGDAHAAALTFNGTEVRLWLDGELVDAQSFGATWAQTDEDFAIGANIWGRNPWDTDKTEDRFEGEIFGAQIFADDLDHRELQALAAADDSLV